MGTRDVWPSPPAWLRRLLPPPFTPARRVVAVLAALLPIVFVGDLVWSFSVSDRLDSAAGQYVRAVVEGRGDVAFRLLCAEARSRTSPAALDGLARDLGGVELVAQGLRGTGTGLWPCSPAGKAGVTLKLRGSETTRYLRMRNEGGWRVCPRPTTDLLGG